MKQTKNSIKYVLLFLAFTFSFSSLYFLISNTKSNFSYALMKNLEQSLVINQTKKALVKFNENSHNNASYSAKKIDNLNLKFYNYSTVFSKKNNFHTPDNATSINLIDLSALSTNNYYSSGKLQLIGNGFNGFSAESIIISEHYAQSLVNSRGLSNYLELVDSELILVDNTNYYEESFKIYGIYLSHSYNPNSLILNEMYFSSFNDPFFVNRERFSTLPGTYDTYGLVGNDSDMNNRLYAGIYDLLRNEISISLLNTDFNKKLVQYNPQLTTEYNSLTENRTFIFQTWLGIIYFTISFLFLLHILMKRNPSFIIALALLIISFLLSSFAFFNFFVLRFSGLTLSYFSSFSLSYVLMYTLILIPFSKMSTLKLVFKEKHKAESTPKVIFILANQTFPNLSAGSIRCITFAKMLTGIGYRVVILGLFSHKIEDYAEDGVFYVNIKTQKLSSSFLNKISNFLLFPYHVFKKYSAASSLYGIPTSIIIYGTFDIISFFTMYFKAKNTKTNIVCDVVESHTIDQMNVFSFFTLFIPNYFYYHMLNFFDVKLITISNYLENHYINRGINKDSIVTIPFIHYVSADNSYGENDYKHKENVITFMYAGFPGKNKDLLETILRGFLIVYKTNTNFKVKLLGLDSNYLSSKKKFSKVEIQTLERFVVFYGRLPHSEVVKIYNKCDFSILLRNNNKRFAKAGFPTKVTQSLAHGLPVISNFSSDLESFLIDGYNSLIVDGHSEQAFANTILRAFTLMDNFPLMRINAYKTAVTTLSSENYLDKLKFIIKRENTGKYE